MSIDSCVISIRRDDVLCQAPVNDLKYVIKEDDTIFLQRGDKQLKFDPTKHLGDILNDDIFAVTNYLTKVTYKINGAEFKASFLTPLVEVDPPELSGGNISGETVSSTTGSVSGGTAPFHTGLSWYQTNKEYDGTNAKIKLEPGQKQQFELPYYHFPYEVWNGLSDKCFPPQGISAWTFHPDDKSIHCIPLVQSSDGPADPGAEQPCGPNAIHIDKILPSGEPLPSVKEGVVIIEKENPWGNGYSREVNYAVDSQEEWEEVATSIGGNTTVYSVKWAPIQWRSPDGCIHQGMMCCYIEQVGALNRKKYRYVMEVRYLDKDDNYVKAKTVGEELTSSDYNYHAPYFKFPWFGHPGVFVTNPASLDEVPSFENGQNGQFRDRNAKLYNGILVQDYIWPTIDDPDSLPPTWTKHWRGSTKSIDVEYITRADKICKRTFDPTTWLPVTEYEVVTDPFLDQYYEFWNINDSNYNTTKVFFIATKLDKGSLYGRRDELICVENGVWSLVTKDDAINLPPTDNNYSQESYWDMPNRINAINVATLDEERLRYIRSNSILTTTSSASKNRMFNTLYEVNLTTGQVTTKTTGWSKMVEQHYSDITGRPGHETYTPWNTHVPFVHTCYQGTIHEHLGGVMTPMYTGLTTTRTMTAMCSNPHYGSIASGNNSKWECKVPVMPYSIFNPKLGAANQTQLLLTDNMVGKYVHSESRWDDPVVNPIVLNSRSIEVLAAIPNYTPMEWTSPPIINFDWKTLDYELVDGGTVTGGIGNKSFSIVEFKYIRDHCIYVLEPPNHADMSYADIAAYQNWTVADGNTDSRIFRYDINEWRHAGFDIWGSFSGTGTIMGEPWSQPYYSPGDSYDPDFCYPEVLTVTADPGSTWSFQTFTCESNPTANNQDGRVIYPNIPDKGDIRDINNVIDKHNYWFWTPMSYKSEAFVPYRLWIKVKVTDDYAHKEYIVDITAPDRNLERRMHLLFQ
jgi:hypothetical protein